MTLSPFQQALGAQFATLPDVLQQFHTNTGTRVFSGRADITHGRGAYAALAVRLAGFPPPGDDVPVTLRVTPTAAGERWDRRFGNHLTCSDLHYEPAQNCIVERFGRVECDLSLGVTDHRLNVGVSGARLFGAPLPTAFLPRSESAEWQDDQGRFRFDIAAYLGRDRLLIRYAGWLLPDAHTAS